ncbi:MAG: hypothetical protein ABJA02_13250 [Acidobacteriota bacterium]
MIAALGILICAITVLYAFASYRSTNIDPSASAATGDNIVTIVPWGPDQAAYDAAARFVSLSPSVRKQLLGVRSRLLSFQPIDSEAKNSEPRLPPARFRAIFYDYSRNRDVVAEGRFDQSEAVTVSFSNEQVPPNDDEFNAAIESIKKDRDLGSALKAGKQTIFPPMPPVLYPYDTSSKVERTVFVGLQSKDGPDKEIVGVNMITGRVIRYPSRAPNTAKAAPESCGLSSSGGSSNQGVAGSARVTISKPVGNSEQVELWDFVVNRPSSSSGSSGSGIELIDIKYKGKMMLKRLHIPVLTVQYTSGCGPFRDWQYAESDFVTPAGSTDPAPGIRFCPSAATTIVENRSDAGNYRGVAVYNQNNATVLVTEMSAGWYRYLNEYQFLNDGTIKPRYGYGSITSSCVCLSRIHHSYWRMDFDVNNANNNVYQTSSAGQPVLESTEYTTFRTPGMAWTIADPTTGDSVTLTPNAGDGSSSGDTFGQSDFWLLRYKTFPAEVNDSSGNGSGINLAPYLNGEATNNQDIVIWYGTHIKRTDDASFANDPVLNGSFLPGPDIKANW